MEHLEKLRFIIAERIESADKLVSRVAAEPRHGDATQGRELSYYVGQRDGLRNALELVDAMLEQVKA